MNDAIGATAKKMYQALPSLSFYLSPFLCHFLDKCKKTGQKVYKALKVPVNPQLQYQKRTTPCLEKERVLG